MPDMTFAERFPGLVEARENLPRWPKKPGRGDRYTLREQRELLGYLFSLAEQGWGVVDDAAIERMAVALREQLGGNDGCGMAAAIAPDDAELWLVLARACAAALGGHGE